MRVRFLHDTCLCRGLCPESVHLLQRRDACATMAPNKTGVQQIECTSKFCERCCQYHTALVGDGEEDICLVECLKNEETADRLQTNFIGKLQQCTDANGDAFSHCTKVSITVRNSQGTTDDVFIGGPHLRTGGVSLLLYDK